MPENNFGRNENKTLRTKTPNGGYVLLARSEEKNEQGRYTYRFEHSYGESRPKETFFIKNPYIASLLYAGYATGAETKTVFSQKGASDFQAISEKVLSTIYPDYRKGNAVEYRDYIQSQMWIRGIIPSRELRVEEQTRDGEVMKTYNRLGPDYSCVCGARVESRKEGDKYPAACLYFGPQKENNSIEGLAGGADISSRWHMALLDIDRSVTKGELCSFNYKYTETESNPYKLALHYLRAYKKAKRQYGQSSALTDAEYRKLAEGINKAISTTYTRNFEKLAYPEEYVAEIKSRNFRYFKEAMAEAYQSEKSFLKKVANDVVHETPTEDKLIIKPSGIEAYREFLGKNADGSWKISERPTRFSTTMADTARRKSWKSRLSFNEDWSSCEFNREWDRITRGGERKHESETISTKNPWLGCLMFASAVSQSREEVKNIYRNLLASNSAEMNSLSHRQFVQACLWQEDVLPHYNRLKGRIDDENIWSTNSEVGIDEDLVARYTPNQVTADNAEFSVYFTPAVEHEIYNAVDSDTKTDLTMNDDIRWDTKWRVSTVLEDDNSNDVVVFDKEDFQNPYLAAVEYKHRIEEVSDEKLNSLTRHGKEQMENIAASLRRAINQKIERTFETEVRLRIARGQLDLLKTIVTDNDRYYQEALEKCPEEAEFIRMVRGKKGNDAPRVIERERRSQPVRELNEEQHKKEQDLTEKRAVATEDFSQQEAQRIKAVNRKNRDRGMSR